MKRLIFVFAFAIVFVFCVGCAEKSEESTESSSVSSITVLPEEAPTDFNIRFVSKYQAEEIYDTYSGVIQKDLVLDGVATATFSPSGEAINEIYSKIIEYKILEISKTMSDDYLVGEDGLHYAVTPCWSYEIRITANGKEYKIKGDDTAKGYTKTNSQAKSFMDFVDFMKLTMRETEEYKKLPEHRGAYD